MGNMRVGSEMVYAFKVVEGDVIKIGGEVIVVDEIAHTDKHVYVYDKGTGFVIENYQFIERLTY